GPDSVSLLCTCDGRAATSDGESQLAYRLPGFGVTMPFRPTDFTQVNHRINEVLVSRAVRLLDPQPGERVADLFCGLGNFSLPLARRAREVVGIEGSATLARRARDNAVLDGLEDRTVCRAANLFDEGAAGFRELGHFD